MKKIETVIEAIKLERIKESLLKINVAWINLYPIKYYGNNETHIERYRSNTYVVDFNIKIRIEVMTNDHNKVDAIIKILESQVNNDIFIVEIADEINISTDRFENFLSNII